MNKIQKHKPCSLNFIVSFIVPFYSHTSVLNTWGVSHCLSDIFPSSGAMQLPQHIVATAVPDLTALPGRYPVGLCNLITALIRKTPTDRPYHTVLSVTRSWGLVLDQRLCEFTPFLYCESVDPADYILQRFGKAFCTLETSLVHPCSNFKRHS
jgi:hypothetical protein